MKNILLNYLRNFRKFRKFPEIPEILCFKFWLTGSLEKFPSLKKSFPIIDLWLFVSCIEQVNSYLPFHQKLFAHIQFVNGQV